MSSAISELTKHRHIDIKAVARLYGCSWRTALRYADSGRIPWGVKLVGLRRWDESEILAHIAAGCPPFRKGGRK